MSVPQSIKSGQGFDAAYFTKLVEIERHSFWFTSRNQLIAWALQRYFPTARQFLEVGCGTGFVLSHVEKSLPCLSLFGSDYFVEALAYAGRRLKAAHFLQMDVRNTPFQHAFDVIGAFDVLEHVDDDKLALSQLYQAVRKTGGIILTVPQHEFLWSRFDEYSCHVRRYNASKLTAKVEQAGFRVIRATSFVSSLLPIMILSRLGKDKTCTEEYDVMQELRLGRCMNALFKRVLDAERTLIRSGITLPFGGSLLVVARKEGGANDRSS